MSPPNSALRNWDSSNVLRHSVALLHGRSLRDCHVPALDRRILVEVDGLPFETRHPRPDGDVGNGIVARDELPIREPAIENAVKPMRFLQVALLRVGCSVLVVFHEMMDLSE